jgi:protein-S-isoprenylcysteine O-methyltransferase Ste14
MVSSILVSALLVAASSLIQTFSKTNWSLPLWVIIIYLLAFVLLLASLIFAIYTVLKGINKIDKKEEAEDIEKKAKLDAIVDKLAITSEEIEAHKPKDNK